MIEATYQVFVDRPRDRDADAVARLAAAIAARYGLPAAELTTRLGAGRFRVKAGIDRATADRFVVDLEHLGAVCSLLDDTGREVTRSRTTTPAPVRSTPPVGRPTPPPTAPPGYASGLAAAWTESTDQDLGVLDDASGAFALAAVDGSDEDRGAPLSIALPASIGPSLPASIGPSLPAARPAPTSKDAFAPPSETGGVELEMELAEVRPRRGSVAPEEALSLAEERSRPATIPARGKPATEQPPVELAAPMPTGLRGALGDPRIRLVAGVVLAIGLGFIPAHLVASMREGPAYTEIDQQFRHEAASTAVEGTDSLDAIRTRWQARKQSRRNDIALGSMLIWAATGSALAFVWFRKLDWDRLAT